MLATIFESGHPASACRLIPCSLCVLCQVKWSADGSKIYANCQENSAIVTIDVATATAISIHAMPLKDWSAAGGTEGIDTEKDGACESMQRVLLMLSGRRGAPRATLNSPLATFSEENSWPRAALYAPQRSYRGEPRLHFRGCMCVVPSGWTKVDFDAQVRAQAQARLQDHAYARRCGGDANRWHGLHRDRKRGRR